MPGFLNSKCVDACVPDGKITLLVYRYSKDMKWRELESADIVFIRFLPWCIELLDGGSITRGSLQLVEWQPFQFPTRSS